MEHALADEELVGRVGHRVGAVLADDEHPVVLGDVEQHAAGGHLVAQIAGAPVVAQLEVALGRLAHIGLFKGDDLGAPGELVAVLVDELFEEVDAVGDDLLHMAFDLAQAGADLLHLLLGAVDIVEGDAADRDLQKGVNILVGHLLLDLVGERLQALAHGRGHLLRSGLLFDRLVDAVLDKDLLQGSGVKTVRQVAGLDAEFGLENIDQPIDVVLEQLGGAGQLRFVLFVDEHQVRRDRHLAVGEGVEGVNHLLGVGAAGQLDLDLDLFGGKVADGGNLDLVLAGGILDRIDQIFGGGAVGNVANDDALGISGIEPGTHQHLAVAIFVLGDVDLATGEEIGEDLERSVPQVADLGFEEFDQVVRQDLGSHAHGDTVGSLGEQDRDLGRKDDRFPVAAVVGILELGEFRIVEDFPGQGSEAALDVARGGRIVAGEDVAEVPLLVDEHILVGQDHQGGGNRLIAVRVVLHGVADDAGHFVETAVVHFEKSVQDATLDRFQAIVDVGDSPVLDDVGSVLDEVAFVKTVDISHQTRFSMMYSRRSGVFLPM